MKFNKIQWNTIKYSEIRCIGLAFTAPWGGEMRGSDRGRPREVSDALYFLVPRFLFSCILPCISLYLVLYFLVFPFISPCILLYFLVSCLVFLCISLYLLVFPCISRYISLYLYISMYFLAFPCTETCMSYYHIRGCMIPFAET